MSQFELNSLPVELFPYVLKKLPAAEITKVLKTCRRVHDIGRRCRHLTRLSIPFISTHTEADETNSLRFCSFTGKCTTLSRVDPDRLRDFRLFRITTDELSIMGAVTSEYLADWVPILKELKITCERLEIYPECAFSCTDSELKQLIQIVKPKQLYCTGILQRESLPPHVFDKVPDIRIASNYSNDDLLAMKQSRLKVASSGVDSRGLHRFLKQWYNNQRTIDEVTISSARPLSVDRIVNRLPVSVLYTPEHHQDSLLKVLEPNPNRESVFVMMKPDDIKNVYILKIDYNSLTVEKTDNPAYYLTSRLACPEYELVTGRCKACDFPMYFCFHHRSLASLLLYTFE